MCRFFKPKEAILPPIASPAKKIRPVFSTDDFQNANHRQRIDELLSKTFENSIHPILKNNLEKGFPTKIKSKAGKSAMDAAEKKYSKAVMDNNMPNIKMGSYGNVGVPEAQYAWYLSQGFIGWNTCAILSQQWLISKACLIPAEDAVRNGYEITVNNGTKVKPEVLEALREYDVSFRVNKNLIQMIHMGRVFGIRVAMFKVDSSDPNYYYKPFNIDGVKPGSYKGISQIDPYWLACNLDDEAAGDPSAIDFYEPTWWIISGKQVHKSHLVIYITEEVPDTLKPTYRYGGIPIPQKIMERVYAAERTANEAPMLALSKRTDVINVDLSQATAQFQTFAERMQQYAYMRDNWATKVLDRDDIMQQFDTSLTDLDAVIMTQYQLVAAECNIPAVKLLGTSPKGFNTSGEYEEATYHEMIEGLQEDALTPLLNRHYELIIRSEICPRFGIKPFEVSIVWESLDVMTAEEQAQVNKSKSETDQTLMMCGAISAEEVRSRLVNDPQSGYNGLDPEDVPEEALSLLDSSSGDGDDD